MHTYRFSAAVEVQVAGVYVHGCEVETAVLS